MTFEAIILAIVLVIGAAPVAQADSVITDFDSASLGSSNPRSNWSAFGNGTIDRGVHSDGSAGRGAYHTVDWGSATWGVGNVSTVAVDLTGFTAIQIDARMVGVSSHSGTAKLRFALDLPGGEWATPSVPLSGAYQSYVFDFATLNGGGVLDLAGGWPKWIVEKNGQSGVARFDFDQIVGVGGSDGPYALTPVQLNPPPDGDAVRAMWVYAGTMFSSATASQAALDFCAREGVNRIYLGAYAIWANGATEMQDNLRTFLATADASGVQVDALLDGIDWQDNPALVRLRIDQILAFQNATADVADDFDAIHFDVEFWLDSSWSSASNETARQQIARNYLDNVLVNARDHLDVNGGAGIGLGVDLSAHMEGSNALPGAFVHDGVTQRFVEHVLDHADDVVFMSYIDSASGLLSWGGYELDLAAGKGRTIQLGADIHYVPPELPINSFADNGPTPFSAMTVALETFHALLTPARAAALDGIAVFHYGSYVAFEPSPRNRADLDADGDVDGSDYAAFATLFDGPAKGATGVARDMDFDGDGNIDLLDFAFFARCFTGAGVGGSLADECLR